MEVLSSIEKLDPIKKSILTVGSYDGIHRGHQKLLSHLVEKSKVYGIPSVLVTFDPHPRHILNKKTNSLPLLMSLDQKLNIVESIGIDIVYVIDFTFHFSKISAQDFMMKIIVPYFNPKIMMIGTNHHFGKNREGSPSFLKNFGEKNHIDIIVIKPVLDNQSQISSSKIRESLL